MAENKLFGTDGVRGVANEFPMVADFAMKLGMAAGYLICNKQHKVAIAKDTRVSGDMLEAALIAGFNTMGVDVVRLGVIPTPAVTCLVSSLNVDMAVMITASHNPYNDNGIKLINAQGDKFDDEVTAELEALVEKNEFEFSAQKIGRVSEDYSLKEKYMQIADLVVKPEALKGMKIVLDCANGCFSDILPEVYRKTGAEVVVLGNKPDGFNINKDCGSQHTDAMCAKVLETGANIGIAVDGDGDRIIICDEAGKRLDGDQIIAYLGKMLHEKGGLKNETVVATIVSNPALDRFLNDMGIKCERSAVGERYVVSKMKEKGSNVGGEESGHMVVSDYSKTGDAMIVSLIVAEGVKKSQQKMSQIFPLFEPMHKVRVDSKFVSNKAKNDALKDVKFAEAIKNAEVKIQSKGKILIRPSGTSPKVQVWVWSDDVELAQKINQEISENLVGLEGFVSQSKTI